jgi:hypothetical protein
MTPMPAVTRDEMNEIIPALRGVYGHHFAEYLYGLYTAAMKVEEREPVHAVRFGQLLKAYGAIRKPKWDKSARQMRKGWIV